MQLQMFTGAPAEACCTALRRGGGNLDRAAAILLDGGGGGDAPRARAAPGDGMPAMPPKEQVVREIFEQIVPADGGTMRYDGMRRFCQLMSEADPDDDEPDVTQDQWGELCQECGFDRNTGMTLAQFDELIFRSLDVDDAVEMR